MELVLVSMAGTALRQSYASPKTTNQKGSKIVII